MGQRTNRIRLHNAITRELALKIIDAERQSRQLAFPNEAELCNQLGVSRTVVRESMKVLADKGMVAMRPKSGTKARPRAEWNLLDPNILAWQAEREPDIRLLLDLCEVRLAIEPTASGFAAVRATPEELQAIEGLLKSRDVPLYAASPEQIVELDLEFIDAVVAASHNPLLIYLNTIMREPTRLMLRRTFRSSASIALGMKARGDLLRALFKKDPVAASRAAEKAVGVSMVAVEAIIKAEARGESDRHVV
jgi:GntR family transcriptional regulator, galactonate operon transcriptional repressor